jgi:peptide deformylase
MRFEIATIPPETPQVKILHWSKIKNLKSAKVNLNTSTEVKALENIIHKMVGSCLTDNGVGLAAPQIGIFKQVVVVRDFTPSKDEEGKDRWVLATTFRALANPSWTAINNDKIVSREMCLSVPNVAFPIDRYKAIELKWDEYTIEENDSVKRTEKTELLERDFAVVMQHEIDHLNGISIPQRWEIQNKKRK